MTPQEKQMIEDLASRINGTVLTEKDPEAEQLLQQLLERNPDARYILAQTVLVQQYALEQAKAQLNSARKEIEQGKATQPKHSLSFLGNLLGLNEEPTHAPTTPPVTTGQPQYSPVQNSGAAQYSPAQANSPQYGTPAYGNQPVGSSFGGQGGFLRSALQTATGVAAGALAFQGIESLMHGFGNSGGYGSSPGFRSGETINNSYGDTATQPYSEQSGDVEDRRFDSTTDEQSSLADQNAAAFADTSDSFSDSGSAMSGDDAADPDMGGDFGASDSGSGNDDSF